MWLPLVGPLILAAWSVLTVTLPPTAGLSPPARLILAVCLLPIAWLLQSVLRGAVGVPVLGAGRATGGVVVAPSAAFVHAAENDGLTTSGPTARDGRVASFLGRSVVWRGARRSRWQGGASRPGYRCDGVRGTFGT